MSVATGLTSIVLYFMMGEWNSRLNINQLRMFNTQLAVRVSQSITHLESSLPEADWLEEELE